MLITMKCWLSPSPDVTMVTVPDGQLLLYILYTRKYWGFFGGLVKNVNINIRQNYMTTVKNIKQIRQI